VRDVIVQTENYQRFLSALGDLAGRGAREACLVVVDGVPGLGKTTILRHWACQADCLYLRAMKTWSAPWMLNEMCRSVTVEPPHGREQRFRALVDVLADRSFRAEEAGEDFAIVIDEVDHILRKGDILETLRDLSDLLQHPIILVGMDRIRKGLARFPQIQSRVGQIVEFKPCTEADVHLLAGELLDGATADGPLLAFLHRSSRGYVREVLEGLAAIERFGRRNGGAATFKAMQGQALFNDRSTGKPIHVR